MKQITLRLPRMKLECRRCRTSWKQAIPRFIRGHAVMRFGTTYVFIADDVRYGLQETIDFDEVLKPLGFVPYPSHCPNCGFDRVFVVRGLLSPHADYGWHDLECLEIESGDFVRESSGWRLRGDVLKKLGATAANPA